MKECTEFNGEMCMNAESNYYGSYGEHCVDCKDKKGVDNMNKINNLFNKLWWLSDQYEPMNDFIEAIKEFTAYMKGNVSIVLIDLYDYGFGNGHLYIAFNDYSDNPNPIMFHAGDFVKYYKEIVEYDKDIQDYWESKLKEILKEYY